MKPIQFILLPILTFLLVVFFRKLKSYPILRFFTTIALLSGMVFTLFQDSSTVVANWLGVGRGVDLVFYLSLLGLGASCLWLYLRVMKLENMLTQLVRSDALEQAAANTQAGQEK